MQNMTEVENNFAHHHYHNLSAVPFHWMILHQQDSDQFHCKISESCNSLNTGNLLLKFHTTDNLG